MKAAAQSGIAVKALAHAFARLSLALGLCTGLSAQAVVVRVGAFPNITHPQAMIGKANGWFEKSMSPDTKIEWKTFNAGPSAIEALFAGAIDMTYVGPNPAINGYVRSNGEALRIIAGATSGGGRASCQERFGNQQARRLPWQADRYPATRQHARCRIASLAEIEWTEDPRKGRRRGSAADCQS